MHHSQFGSSWKVTCLTWGGAALDRHSHHFFTSIFLTVALGGRRFNRRFGSRAPIEGHSNGITSGCGASLFCIIASMQNKLLRRKRQTLNQLWGGAFIQRYVSLQEASRFLTAFQIHLMMFFYLHWATLAGITTFFQVALQLCASSHIINNIGT